MHEGPARYVPATMLALSVDATPMRSSGSIGVSEGT